MLKGLGREARTVVISVIASTLVVGVPATAAVIATNSDKVDGLHAVGAGAGPNVRKGKLVATHRATGRLPNNIIAKAPDANRLDRLDSTAFLRRTGKAADANLLDGVNSSGFLRGVRMRTGSTFSISAGSFNEGTASCLAGEYATGGGAYPRSNVLTPRITASFPTPNPNAFTAPGNGTVPTGWHVYVANEAYGAIEMTPYVLCIGATP